MRWTHFITFGQAIWLSCLKSGHASGLAATESLVRRQDGFVYRGDGRSPQELRGTGGFQPQGDGWADHDSSFDLNRHYSSGPNGCGLDESDEPGFVFRTAYVSATTERSTAETYGQWLYEIRATPNILDNDDSEGEVMALGGIHWRQIRRYTRMRDTGNRVDEASWVENPDYDAETYERGPYARRCRVSTTFPGVLAGNADSDSDSDSDSDNSDSESSGSNARRLFNAADIFMDRTPGIYELYGGFPPTFTQYSPRADIPGPDHPAAPEAEDAQIGGIMQHYADIGPGLDGIFPDGAQALQDLLGNINTAACPSFLGFGSNLGRSERGGRAAGKHGCCKMLSSFRKKTKANGAKSNVELCENGPLNPPCTTVQAPRSKCVAVPQEYKGKVSGVKVHDTTSICRFYLEEDCKGDYFEADHHGVDLYQSRPAFNDNVASFACDTAKAKAAPEHWQWTPQSQGQLCARLDQLSLDFELANNYGAGTYDKIKLDFVGAGQKPHVIVEGPSPGFKVSQDIDMVETFGLDTVALDQIKKIRLLDELTDWSFGGDAWDLLGFKLRGRCAGSGISVLLDDFAAVNKELKAQPTAPGRFAYRRDWEVWSGDVKREAWGARPLCSHFHSMSVNLAIADANWAGTSNNLYANVGEGRFLIAQHPSRREVFTVEINVEKAYKTKTVPVANVDLVGIASEGGHDAALPKEVTVYGFCSGAHAQALSVKQEITDWVYDATQLNIKLAPDMWVKV